MQDERLTQIEQEKSNKLNDVNSIYDQLLSERQNLTEQQKNLINTYQTTQDKIADDNLAHQTELYNQQKDRAKESYDNEVKNSYESYLKATDKYGVNAENMASNGLLNSNVSESSRTNMYNTYQNRVASARKSYNDAILNFDNSMKEAKLNYDAAKAERAYQTLQQQVALIESEFNYKDSTLQNKMSYLNQIDDTYYNRTQNVINQINYEKEQEEAIRQYNESMAFQKQQAAQNQKNWEKEYALSKSKSGTSSSGGSSSNYTLTDNSNSSETYNRLHYLIENAKRSELNRNELIEGLAQSATREYNNNNISKSELASLYEFLGV